MSSLQGMTLLKALPDYPQGCHYPKYMIYDYPLECKEPILRGPCDYIRVGAYHVRVIVTIPQKFRRLFHLNSDVHNPYNFMRICAQTR